MTSFSTAPWLDLKVNQINFNFNFNFPCFFENWFLILFDVVMLLALSTWNAIGSLGARNFTLCRKPEVKKVDERSSAINGARKGRSLKAWINKSFSLKVSSH